jgi:hypothetical protein
MQCRIIIIGDLPVIAAAPAGAAGVGLSLFTRPIQLEVKSASTILPSEDVRYAAAA